MIPSKTNIKTTLSSRLTFRPTNLTLGGRCDETFYASRLEETSFTYINNIISIYIYIYLSPFYSLYARARGRKVLR